MEEQILEEKQEKKQESAITIVPPKEAISEMITEVKKLKNRKDDLLLPIKDELDEMEENTGRIYQEIFSVMKEANKDGIILDQVRNNDGVAIFKLPPKPHKFYKKEKLDAITKPEIRQILDNCIEESKQGDPTVKIEIW